jgi:hypothetical protein
MKVILPPHLLETAIKGNLIPFIGAGFSRVFKLPTWSELIANVSGQIGYDPEVAELYGDFLQLAEFLSIKQNGLSRFKSGLIHQFNSPSINIVDSEAHSLLTKMKLSKIYTTNWDNLLEKTFEYHKIDYNKLVTIEDFQDSNPSYLSIIKFHGDLSSSDDSLVFTESSYFERLSFESPLDISLRSDMIGNTLIFLGYSLSDFNIRYMWYKLQMLLKEQAYSKRRDPFAYIVVTKRNPIFEEICKNSRDIGIIYLDPNNVQNSMIELLDTIVNHVN